MGEWNIDDVDVDAYHERLGVERVGGAPHFAMLARLHRAHVTAIPFENLEPFLGSAPSLALADIADKLVTRRRGGYCFEQNLLFAAVLERSGFRVDRLAARVRMGRDIAAPGPRTHMALRVEVPDEDGSWLADVGFGGMGPLGPVPMSGAPSEQGPWRFVAREEGDGGYALECRGPGADLELYGFSLEPQHHSDYVVANHFTGTYPRSPFVTAPFVARIAEHERITWRGTTLSVRSERGIEERTIAPADVDGLVRELGLALTAADLRPIRARLEGDRDEGTIERVRAAVVDAMVAAYDEAGMQGLCGEGRFELAVDRARTVEVP